MPLLLINLLKSIDIKYYILAGVLAFFTGSTMYYKHKSTNLEQRIEGMKVFVLEQEQSIKQLEEVIKNQNANVAALEDEAKRLTIKYKADIEAAKKNTAAETKRAYQILAVTKPANVDSCTAAQQLIAQEIKNAK